MSEEAPDRSETTDIPTPEELPPLPEGASPEEKDLHWFTYVYQGDRMRQLTVRAVLMGGILGMFMSISNLYTTVKLGWAFGVAITACVLSFVVWNAIRAAWNSLFPRKISMMTILENNCMQSTASAAGYSTGGTIGTAFGAWLLITGEHIACHMCARVREALRARIPPAGSAQAADLPSFQHGGAPGNCCRITSVRESFPGTTTRRRGNGNGG